MSLQLEFEPHSWYMGFAIKKSYGDDAQLAGIWHWSAYTDEGMTYRIIELEGFSTLSGLKQEIRDYHLRKRDGYGERIAAQRLKYLRGELQAERISYSELGELTRLIPYIDSEDVELLEAAGVPEN